MSQNPSVSLINLGDLSRPATVLIDKISGAVGWVFEPYQITRVAKAEAKAEIIGARSRIEVTDLHRRAAHRLIEEEAQRQRNMEDITAKAVPHLDEDANPADVEDDWIVNFFDKSRIVSDNEMQQLWSRILAGEANSPGSYAKRTVNLLADLDKSEAELFAKLCGFVFMFGGMAPLVFDHEASIYNEAGIDFGTLSHLDSIGLINFTPISTFIRKQLPRRFMVFYYGRQLALEMPKASENTIECGQASFTLVGEQIAPICGSQLVEGFWEYVCEQWKAYLPG